jgi:hypothetical protein
MAAAAVVVALMAGLIAGSSLSFTQDANEPEVPKAAAPEAPKTAYIDFLSLLKKDKLLAKEQFLIQEKLQGQLIERNLQFKEDEAANLESVKGLKAEDPLVRQAMNKMNDLRYKYELEMQQIRMLGEEALRKEGIEGFQRLRGLTNTVATNLGYTQVLNIAGNLSEVLDASQNDFQALQQQLLLSPVLMYDPAHNITKAVEERAKEEWDLGIAVADITASIVAANGGGVPLVRNAAGEFEITLGQIVQFTAAVTAKEQLAEGDAAKVVWRRTGIGAGALDDKTGKYTAPDTMPQGGDTFEVIVRSMEDPTITKRVTIRLINPAKKE